MALFDSPAADQQLTASLLSACSESFLAPILTELFVSEGLERDIAECVAPLVAELMADASDVFAALDTPGGVDQDPELAATMMAEMFTIMSECGAVEDLFLQ